MFQCVCAILLLVGVASGSPEVIAHRGASQDAPENTLAAFNLAWQQGTDAVEGDFRLTKDGVVVCCHDVNTKNVSDRTLTVAESTFAELRELDVGAWKGPRWRGQQMPTAAEVFAAVPPGKRVYVEIKSGPEIFPALKKALAESKLQPRQAVILAFEQEVDKESKRQLPQHKVVWLKAIKKDKTSGQWKPTTDEILETLKQIGADGVSAAGAAAVIDADYVARIRRAGYIFQVGAVDDDAFAKGFLQSGVDSMTTNRPGWLQGKLKELIEKKP